MPKLPSPEQSVFILEGERYLPLFEVERRTGIPAPVIRRAFRAGGIQRYVGVWTFEHTRQNSIYHELIKEADLGNLIVAEEISPLKNGACPHCGEKTIRQDRIIQFKCGHIAAGGGKK